MPRFVLLYHECPPQHPRASHWDFMLEADKVLHTWALAELPDAWRSAHLRTEELRPGCPALAVGDEVEAQQLDPHRLAYLDYEGPVSDERGQVWRIDHGRYALEHDSPLVRRIELIGGMLRGKVVLLRTTPNAASWTLRS
jgi:hypothetical protein